jgi:hypothetical protein
MRPGPGIEQNRNDGEIDLGPGGFGRVGSRSDQSGAIHPTGREMPPAAVAGNRKVRIAASSDIDDAANGLIHTGGNQPEMPRFTTLGNRKDDAAALAYSGGGQQFRRLVSRRGHGP